VFVCACVRVSLSLSVCVCVHVCVCVCVLLELGELADKTSNSASRTCVLCYSTLSPI